MEAASSNSATPAQNVAIDMTRLDIPCVECNKEIKNVSNAIQCKLCMKLSHPKCIKVTDDVRQSIKNAQVFYICGQCKLSAERGHFNIERTQRHLAELSAHIKARDNKLRLMATKLRAINEEKITMQSEIINLHTLVKRKRTDMVHDDFDQIQASTNTRNIWET